MALKEARMNCVKLTWKTTTVQTFTLIAVKHFILIVSFLFCNYQRCNVFSLKSICLFICFYKPFIF